MKFRVFLLLLAANVAAACHAQSRFNVLALYENGGHHLEYSKAAVKWLNQLAADSNFRIDYTCSTDSITQKSLAQYQLFIQLDYPPYGWKPAAVKAFEGYIERGTGGWIGFHHATLLGEFDGNGLWPWFYRFMGSIRFRDYIPGFADGTVKAEVPNHPVFDNMPDSFLVEREEWYTYDKSPRANVSVLASVDERSYKPDSKIKMGDHPVVWTNTSYKACNIYIFMGHSPSLFANTAYTTLFRNSIFWAVKKTSGEK
ncbi:MAG: ThuA domain-containing protein [Chitinophagaceae bacterium]|nr:MAG: ThuA domain-containing protein [Chitinophagaceae bacterium]